MDDMETVTLRIATKCGGKIWPEGEQDVPAGLVGDLRKAGVLVEPEPAPEPEQTEPKPPVVPDPSQSVPLPAIEGLSDEQSQQLRNLVAGIPDQERKEDGTPKVDAVNKALKAADAGFAVKADQIAAAMPKADADGS